MNFLRSDLSRLKNYSCRSIFVDNVSLKRVISIIVRVMLPRENDAPRRAVMITQCIFYRVSGTGGITYETCCAAFESMNMRCASREMHLRDVRIYDIRT